MKLGDNGEAFFVQETEEQNVSIPSEVLSRILITAPNVFIFQYENGIFEKHLHRKDC